MKLLLFDIDGTLLSAGPSPMVAFETAFAEQFSIAGCWGDTQPHGRTDPDIVGEICRRVLQRELNAAELTRLFKRYAVLLEPEISQCQKFRVLPGALALCQRLAASERFYLGIETGNIEPAGRIKLARGGLDSFFTFGGWGSDSADRSEIVRIAIERARSIHDLPNLTYATDVVVIGDAPQDIQAGQALGARTIAVATGRYGNDELEAHQPTAVLDTLDDIPGFLQAADLTLSP
ncbi:MAG: HAD hydrolase-like protein [Bdellovibrionales bacterium]|nr:HAD hydrolase-like protein [Bdellovibrionales bacterium]